MVITDRLRRARALTFRALTGDSPDMVTTVARFLALLELFREGAVAFEQLAALGELTIRWTGARRASWTSPTSSTLPGRRRPPLRRTHMNPELSDLRRLRPGGVATSRSGAAWLGRWRPCCCWPPSR